MTCCCFIPLWSQSESSTANIWQTHLGQRIGNECSLLFLWLTNGTRKWHPEIACLHMIKSWSVSHRLSDPLKVIISCYYLSSLWTDKSYAVFPLYTPHSTLWSCRAEASGLACWCREAIVQGLTFESVVVCMWRKRTAWLAAGITNVDTFFLLGGTGFPEIVQVRVRL